MYNNNTPVRNRKVGLPDPQGNGGQATPQNNGGNAPVTISGPSQMVQQMAAQNYALKNGGQMPPQNAGVQSNPAVRHSDGTPVTPTQYMGVSSQNRVVGRFEAQRPVIRGGNGMAADGTSGYIPSSASSGQNQGNMPIDYPMGDDNQGGQPVVRHPDGRVAATPPPAQNGYPSVLGDPTKVSQKDLASLSDALNAAQSRQANFNADPSKRDGGFFGWLRGLMPKNRPGRREGETDDEYDARRTRNMQMVATFVDAIRHMGNIVNTSKGAPLQVFNDPSTMLEQGAKERKAQRQKDAAAKMAAEKAQNEMTLKQQAAEADRAYKQFNMDMQQNKFNYQKGRDDMADKKWQAKFEFDAAKDDRDFQYKQIRDKVKDGQWQAGYGIKVANLNLSRARFAHTLAKDAKGGGTGGSGYAYATPYGSLYSKKQLSTQQENQMWSFMVRNGQITKKKLKEYELAAKGDGGAGLYGTDKGSTSRSRRIMQECIAYGLMDATEKGDNFRKFCTSQLGMGEDRVYNTPQNPTTWKKGSVKQGQTGKLKI